MKRFVLLLIIVMAISYASALTETIGTNATYFVNTTTGGSGEWDGAVFVPNVNVTVSSIGRSAISTGLRCIVIDHVSLAIMENATFSSNNICSINANLTAGRYYRIVVDTEPGYQITYNNTLAIFPSYPSYRLIGNFTGGCFGDSTDKCGTYTFNSTIYNILNITLDYQASQVQPTLVSPAHQTVLTDTFVFFNTSLMAQDYNFTNATIYLYNPSFSLVNKTTNVVKGTTYNSTSWNISIGNTTGQYTWNVLGCGINGTGTLCSFALSNFTFTRTNFQIDSVVYNTTAYETSHQIFYLNTTVDSSVIGLTAFLIYQNVSYPAYSTCSGVVCNTTRSIDIPTIPANGRNHTFYWNVRSFDGFGYTILNTSTYNQTITQISLSTTCVDRTYIALNFTAYDEKTLTRVNPYKFTGTFLGWLGGGSTYRNFSISSASTAEITLCIDPKNVTLHTNADIQYNNVSDLGYVTRNYYLSNASLVNNSVAPSTNLYLLNSGSSTSFILEVTDETLTPLNDTLIYVQRYYPDTGTYNTVQIAITDNNGKSVGFFEVETVEYKFILVRNGAVILETERKKVFPETAPYTLTFRVGTQAGDLFSPYENLSNLFYRLDYNESQRMVTYTYIDSSGTTQYGRLLVQTLNNRGLPYTICNVNATQSSATLTCNVTGYNGTIIAKAYISRSPERLVALINEIIDTAVDVFGRGGLLMGILILMAIALVTMSNPTVLIIAEDIGVIVLSIIGVITFSPIFIFGFLAVSVIILILLKI